MLTKTDLKDIDLVLSERIKEELNPIKKDAQTIKSDIIQIRKDQKTIINYFDNEYLELRKRIERLEHHLNLPPLS